MTPEELACRIGAELVVGGRADAAIRDAYASDLLSDALANAAEGALLITVLAHVNVIAVCSAAGLPAVLVCRGRPVPPDTRLAARREGVAVLATARNAYRASLAVGRAFGHAEDAPVPSA